MNRIPFVVVLKKDEDRLYADTFLKAFVPFINTNKLLFWSDEDVLAGEHVEGRVKNQIDEADILLPLISNGFLSDKDYISYLRYALGLHDEGKIRVIPVMLRPCNWQTIDLLEKFKRLPEEGFLSNYNNDLDNKLLEISQKILVSSQVFLGEKIARQKYPDGIPMTNSQNQDIKTFPENNKLLLQYENIDYLDFTVSFYDKNRIREAKLQIARPDNPGPFENNRLPAKLLMPSALRVTEIFLGFARNQSGFLYLNLEGVEADVNFNLVLYVGGDTIESKDIFIGSMQGVAFSPPQVFNCAIVANRIERTKKEIPLEYTRQIHRYLNLTGSGYYSDSVSLLYHELPLITYMNETISKYALLAGLYRVFIPGSKANDHIHQVKVIIYDDYKCSIYSAEFPDITSKIEIQGDMVYFIISIPQSGTRYYKELARGAIQFEDLIFPDLVIGTINWLYHRHYSPSQLRAGYFVAKRELKDADFQPGFYPAEQFGAEYAPMVIALFQLNNRPVQKRRR